MIGVLFSSSTLLDHLQTHFLNTCKSLRSLSDSVVGCLLMVYLHSKPTRGDGNKVTGVNAYAAYSSLVKLCLS